MKYVKTILKKGFPCQASHHQTKPESLRLLLSEVIVKCLQNTIFSKKCIRLEIYFEIHWNISHPCGYWVYILILLTRVDDIGKSIVAAAKEIVIKQRISSKRNPEEEEKSGFQLRVDSRLQHLENKIDGLEGKIDRILSAMARVGNH